MAKVGEREKRMRALRESQVEETSGFEAHRLKVADAIRRGRRAFHDLGEALREIRDTKSYREKYDTFEACCREEWGISDRHARRLISGADVMSLLATGSATDEPTGPTGPKTTDKLLPETERQTRPLAGLDEDAASKAWEGAVEDAGDEQPTAAQVERAVERVNGRPPEPPSPEPEPPPEHGTAEDHEPSAHDELVIALEENARLRDTLADLESDDTAKALIDLRARYGQLESRLNQALRTSSEAEKDARYCQGELRKIRKELGVEKNQDILPAIRTLKAAG